MTRRMSSSEIFALLAAQEDGLPMRPVRLWSLEKLAIVALYLNAFTGASSSVGGGIYVDGFAGPGLCKVRGAIADPRFVYGSPMLALKAEPGFEMCHFTELSRQRAQALEYRTRDSSRRRTIHTGDANKLVPSILRDAVHQRAPCFCLLDPEGLELHWTTVEAIALTPGRRRKPELLILFPSSWLLRLLPRKGEVSAKHEQVLDSVLPGREWRDIYSKRLSGEIHPATAKDAYVELYRQGLESLGYTAFSHAVEAPSQPGGRRRERYQLVFATQHEAGAQIMADVFKRPYVLDFPVSAQRPLFE